MFVDFFMFKICDSFMKKFIDSFSVEIVLVVDL